MWMCGFAGYLKPKSLQDTIILNVQKLPCNFECFPIFASSFYYLLCHSLLKLTQLINCNNLFGFLLHILGEYFCLSRIET